MSAANWSKPLRWNKAAQRSGSRHLVFSGSMCDWADNNAPSGQRDRLFDLIRQTPSLTWQLLTKRQPNIHRYLPDDWHDGYDNVWLGVTVENQKDGLPRLHRLRNIPAKLRFLSIEPLLEDLGDIDLTGIHWVIIGGESGNRARPMEPEWVDNIIRQCREQQVPVFFKQWGGRANKGGCLIVGAEVKEWPVASN
jgi:protein gp37